MIHLSVVANDPVLADAIASVLAEDVILDEVWLTHRELGKGDRYSVVIIVDEDELENETIKVTDLFREEISLLVIKLSLKSRNIFVYESYQLNNPRIERVINLVRDFGRANLKKKVEKSLNKSALQEMAVSPRFQVYADPAAGNL